MRRALVLAALALSAAPASAADFSGGSLVLYGSFGAHQIATWDLPVRFDGAVTTDFEGPFGHGHTVWNPGATGQLSVGELKTSNGRSFAAFIGATDAHGVTARVDRPGGAICSDTASAELDEAIVERRSDGIRVGLAPRTPGQGGFEMSETRCGGPLSEDLGQVLPMVKVSNAQLRSGGFDIDLRGSGPFAAGGLSGTVSSTIVMHVGKRAPARKTPKIPESQTGMRQLSVRYRVVRVSGGIDAAPSGSGPLCADLDSCGAHERIALRMGDVRGASFNLIATGPQRRPLANLQSAVGLRAGGNRRGITTTGFGAWSSKSSTVGVSLDRGGSTVCQDNRHAREFALELDPGARRLSATLAAYGPVRSVCPGPALSDGLTAPPVATGSIARSALRHKTITLHLTRGDSLTTDGWIGVTHPDVTIVLRRRSVRTTTLSF